MEQHLRPWTAQSYGGLWNATPPPEVVECKITHTLEYQQWRGSGGNVFVVNGWPSERSSYPWQHPHLKLKAQVSGEGSAVSHVPNPLEKGFLSKIEVSRMVSGPVRSIRGSVLPQEGCDGFITMYSYTL